MGKDTTKNITMKILTTISILLLIFIFAVQGMEYEAKMDNFIAKCDIMDGRIITTYIEHGLEMGSIDKRYCLLNNGTEILWQK